MEGVTVPTDSDTLNLTLREPYGVCGLIVPVSLALRLILNILTLVSGTFRFSLQLGSLVRLWQQATRLS